MATTTFYAGRLKHRINIEAPIAVQDALSGEMVITGWTPRWSDVPAEIRMLSAREFIESSALQSTVAGVIVVRYRVGVTAKMRCVHDDNHGTITYYQIAGHPIRDPDTGLEWLSLPVEAGIYDG
jgi:SPP1 family predicted phage head-tail adaptor